MDTFERVEREASRDVEEIAREVVDAAFKVHRELGPGLLESAYEIALFHELTKRGLRTRRQVPVHVKYDGVDLGVGFRVDVLVEETIIVELKAVQVMSPVFQAQIITHLRLSKRPIGFLINFHEPIFKRAIKRYRI